MALPAYIPVRTVGFRGVLELEQGKGLTAKVAVRSSGSLRWADTGELFETLGGTFTSGRGASVTFPLPVTDDDGWLTTANEIIDVSEGGAYTHTYTATVVVMDASGRQVGDVYEYGPFVVPASESTLWLDELEQQITVAGSVVARPTVYSVNGQDGAVTITAAGLGAYVKPGTGVPKTDLASAVQTSLGKADTAVQPADVGTMAAEDAADYLTATETNAAYVGRAQLDRVPAVKRGVVPSEVARVMSTPPTVGALSATSAIGSGIGAAFNGRVEGVSSSALNRSRFNFYAGKITSLGTGFPDYQFAKARYLTDPSAGNGGPGAVEFLYDGASFEFVSKGAGQKVLIVVDGEYVSKTPTTFTNDGSAYYLPVTFATAKPRKIRIEFLDQVILGFVRFEATATLTAPRTSAPFMMIAGDSFSEGVGGGYSNVPWWRTFADALGIPNVWSASLGGTGWLKTGPSGRATIRGRMATDVYPYAPDILVLAAGINDASVPYSEAAIKTEVLATIADVRENLPNTLLVVVDTFASGGVEKNVNLIPIHKGIKAACTEASVPFLSVFELPMLGVPFSTTLAANANAGATSISLAAPVAQQTTLDLGTERRVVTALSGSGPYTATVTALTYAHASGDPVSVVGGSLWTGTGRVGATTGVGNSDRLVASDNTHPTQVASDLIGLHLADQFVDLSLSA